MKAILFLFLLVPLIYSCNKKIEKASRIAGVWEITETKITSYVNNEISAEELIDQSGILILGATGSDDNDATTNLPNPPCPASCFWNLPKRGADQLFFYYYDGNYTLITSSCMIEKLTKKEMTLLKVDYDADLNIVATARWTFTKGKL